MLKKIWQSFVRWFRKLSKKGAGRSIDRSTTAELPPLDDTDREYLFMQLLEGVAHGWQQPRAVGFFNKIRQRVRKSEWLEWLDKFGNSLMQAPVPNYELAGRMVQLAELDCGEIGDLAGEYGVRLLNRQAADFSGNLLPIMEFEAMDSGANRGFEQFPELPAELLVDNDPMTSTPSGFLGTQAEQNTETREITLEEFSAMLNKDPDLVAELAEQFGIQTTDPQEIVNIVIEQMQQQVPPVEENPTPVVAAPIIPPPPPLGNLPSPPPLPKLEYKPEDPWSTDRVGNGEELRSETVNAPDRGV
jgi:hypothetical protein